MMHFTDAPHLADNFSHSNSAEISCMSNDELSIRSAETVRQHAPDSIALSERIKERNILLNNKKWELFDQGNKGYITFDEYFSMEWAGFLLQAAPGRRTVSKNEFLMRFLGDPNSATSGWKLPYQANVFIGLYNSIDPTGRGFITMDDIRSTSLRSFQLLDKNHDGHLSKDEFP